MLLTVWHSWMSSITVFPHSNSDPQGPWSNTPFHRRSPLPALLLSCKAKRRNPASSHSSTRATSTRDASRRTTPTDSCGKLDHFKKLLNGTKPLYFCCLSIASSKSWKLLKEMAKMVWNQQLAILWVIFLKNKII